MQLERSLLAVESRVLLWLTSLSSDVLVNLSSKLVFFSNECLLARLITVKTSSLQEPRTFPSGYDSLIPPPPFFLLILGITFLFFLELPCWLAEAVHCWGKKHDPKQVSATLAENEHRILYISIIAERRLTWRPLVYLVHSLSLEMCFHSLCGAK